MKGPNPAMAAHDISQASVKREGLKLSSRTAASQLRHVPLTLAAKHLLYSV